MISESLTGDGITNLSVFRIITRINGIINYYETPWIELER